MKRIKMMAGMLVLIVLLMLSACSNPVYEGSSPFDGQHEYDGAFVGELPEIKGDLPVFSCDITEEKCVFQEKTYVQIIPEGVYERWELDCNYLKVLGKLEDDTTIYAIQEEEENIALLFVGADAQNLQVSWYILEDRLEIMDPYSYTIQDFIVHRVEGREYPGFTNEDVWTYHLSSKYTETAIFWYEVYETHCLALRSKSYHWLVYKLTYVTLRDIPGHCLCIFNLPNDGYIMLTQDGSYVHN